VGQRVTGNTGSGVGINQRLVEVGFFGGIEGRHRHAGSGYLGAAEHQAEQTVQGDQVGAQGIIGLVTINHPGQVKGVNAGIGVQAESDVTTPHCL